MPEYDTPISRKGNIQPRPAFPSEAGLFFGLKPEQDALMGTIGHVRMDFGHGGKEFHHTWWPRGPETLNTPEFKDELTEVVDFFRTGPLKDLEEMSRYCREHHGEIQGGICTQNYGYVVDTEQRTYYLRCNPTPGDYQAYLTIFDKRVQETRQAQKKQEIQDINREIAPFYVDMHSLGDYYLGLDLSSHGPELSAYGQYAFNSFAEAKGLEPLTRNGLHICGSGYDWDKVFRYAFRDQPAMGHLKYDSEAGHFFCDSGDLELLKSCALTMKGIVENHERFTGLVREALDWGLAGRLTFANGDVLEFTDPAEYVQWLKKEIEFVNATGLSYETLTDDPQARKAVDDILHDFFGEENPRPLEDYQNKPKTMEMGGIS